MVRPYHSITCSFFALVAQAALAQPTVSGLQPPAATAGGPALTLVVNGRGFTGSTRITWDGTVLPSRFESSSRIVVDVPNALLARAGSALIGAIEEKVSGEPFPFIVNPPIQWTTSMDLAVAPLRQFYSQALSVFGGTPPIRFSLVGGSLPAGLHFDGYNGSIVGYATAEAAAELVVRATDASGAFAAQKLRLTAAEPLRVISDTTLPPAKIGQPYSSSITATGGVIPVLDFSITAGTLPAGLSLDAGTGRIAGTPQAVGTSNFSVRVRDGYGRTTTAALTLAVIPALTIVPPSGLDGYVEQDWVELRLSAQGGVPPYTWTLIEGRLPPGLELVEAEGLVHGTIQSAGGFPATVQVRDRAGTTVYAPLYFGVGVPLRVSKPFDLPAAYQGMEYSCRLRAEGGVPPYRWVVRDALPPGLRMDGPNLVGRPTAEGRFHVRVEVLDSNDRRSAGVLVLSVEVMPLPGAFVSLPGSLAPSSQHQVALRLDRAYTLDLEGEFELAFEPAVNGIPDDPAVQLSTGGRVVRFRLGAGELTPVSPVLLQTGSTAGVIVWTLRLVVAGRPVRNPDAEAVFQGRSTIPPTPPQVRSVKAMRTVDGFEVVAAALSPTRELDSAVFAFDDAAQVTVPLARTAADWYGGENSAPHGTAFVYRQIFTVRGDSSRLRGVSLVLRNSVGASVPVSAAF